MRRYLNILTNLVEQRLFWNNIYRFLRHNKVKGAYYEFGLYKGENFGRVLRDAGELFTAAYGYDSFHGLPNSEGQFKAGDYHSSLEEFQANMGGVKQYQVHKGWFKDTFRGVPERASLINLDCDLSSSADDIFRHLTIDSFVTGAILYIDDFYCHKGQRDRGVQKSFYKWAERTGVELVPFLKYKWHGQSFIIQGGRE